jgi:hypothetical protein
MQRCCATETGLALPTSNAASNGEMNLNDPNRSFVTEEAGFGNLIE